MAKAYPFLWLLIAIIHDAIPCTYMNSCQNHTSMVKCCLCIKGEDQFTTCIVDWCLNSPGTIIYNDDRVKAANGNSRINRANRPCIKSVSKDYWVVWSQTSSNWKFHNFIVRIDLCSRSLGVSAALQRWSLECFLDERLRRLSVRFNRSIRAQMRCGRNSMRIWFRSLGIPPIP